MDVIVEFRVGLMALTDGRLVADPRKGVLRVCQVGAGPWCFVHVRKWCGCPSEGGACMHPARWMQVHLACSAACIC